MEIFFYESRRIRRSFRSLLAIAAVIAALCGFSRVYSDALAQKQAEIEEAYDGLSVDVVISNIQGTKTGQLNIPDYYGALFFPGNPDEGQDASLAPYLKDICMVSHLYYDASSEKEIRGITDLSAAPELAEIEGTVITMLEQEDGLWQSSEKKCLVSYGRFQTLTPEANGNYRITLSVCPSSQGGNSITETFRVVGYYSGDASRIYIPWRTATALLKNCNGYYTIDSIRATVSDNRQIASLQDALSRYFSPVDPTAGTGEPGRFAATILDETLNQTIHSLKQNRNILKRLWPVVFCVAMLIAFGVSFYAVLTRKRELIALRFMGVRKSSVGAMVLGEIALSALLGVLAPVFFGKPAPTGTVIGALVSAFGGAVLSWVQTMKYMGITGMKEAD